MLKVEIILSNKQLRWSQVEDINRIMEIIDANKAVLKAEGIDQWQNNYPNRNVILNDILIFENYVYEVSDEIVGTLMLSFEEDATYHNIDGSWLNDDSYATIHRIAVDPLHKHKHHASNMLNEVIKKCLEQDVKNIRVDTHPDNKAMTQFLLKNDFKHCGVIYLKDGNAREAYQRIL